MIGYTNLSLLEDDEGARFAGAGFGFRACGFGAGFSANGKNKQKTHFISKKMQHYPNLRFRVAWTLLMPWNQSLMCKKAEL